jgi:hypothetical protein
MPDASAHLGELAASEDVLDRLWQSGIDPIWVDLSRPDTGVCVTKTIVPAFQSPKSRNVTDRLAHEAQSNGVDPARRMAGPSFL